ncbi:hypothetical protein BSKO_12387 [Bryopsis sp. KO-2023]|nr:hypothetical protein BSKO_12387 [Bryopsis sp. KO-2023]
MEKYREQLTLSLPKILELGRDIKKQLQFGLEDESPSCAMMLPSFVLTLPSGDEQGDFFAIDLGGTNFRVMHCKLGCNRGEVLAEHRKEFSIPDEKKQGTVRQLFDYIAESLKSFVENECRGCIDTSQVKLGFCFSFPMQKSAPDVGRLMTWTKGYEISDGIGEDAVQLLKESCERAGIAAQIPIIMNDTIGVLAAGRYEDDSTDIGVILGTGTNAACCIPVGDIPKWQSVRPPDTPDDLLTAVNTEWGSYNSPMLPRCQEDLDFDADHYHAGKYIFEKMVCGYALGEVCRRILLTLCREGCLFEGQPLDSLEVEDSFLTASLSAIESDTSEGLSITEKIFREEFKIHPNSDDLVVVKEVCDLVTKRAAFLIAIALVAVIQLVFEKTGTPMDRKQTVITVDGGVFEKFDTLRRQIDEKLHEYMKEVFGENPPEVVLRPSHGGSCMGAAVLAASC